MRSASGNSRTRSTRLLSIRWASTERAHSAPRYASSSQTWQTKQSQRCVLGASLSLCAPSTGNQTPGEEAWDGEQGASQDETTEQGSDSSARARTSSSPRCRLARACRSTSCRSCSFKSCAWASCSTRRGDLRCTRLPDMAARSANNVAIDTGRRATLKGE